MKRPALPIVLLLVVISDPYTWPQKAQGTNAPKPTWAKKAVAFPEECRERPDYPKCKPIAIPSPDGRSRVEVYYKKRELGRDSDPFMYAELRVTTPDKGTRDAALPDGFQQIDLLWSPDSKKFFVNGGDGGAIWGFWMYAYLLDGAKIKAEDIAGEAQRDMVKTFPPCKAAYLERDICRKIEKDPRYNISGIDWTADSSAIVVMAEVPCSGLHGGIMCQVMGYELEVPTGKICKRLTARQLKQQWQKSMAWNFRVPGSPDYQ